MGRGRGAGRQARAALAFVPARLLDSTRLLELRAWFARRRQDVPTEKKLLEELLTKEPGRTATLMRLAELLQLVRRPATAGELRRRKAELDAALDRYLRLYRDDRYADHLPELAVLAERLGRPFEARGFWELVRDREPSNAAAQPRWPGSLRAPREPSPPVTGSLAQVLEAIAAIPPRVPPASRARAWPRSDPPVRRRGGRAGLAGFIQDNGSSPIHQLPEMASGGVGLLDYDGDGFLDVYCVQGGIFPPGPNAPSPRRRSASTATGAMGRSRT